MGRNTGALAAVLLATLWGCGSGDFTREEAINRCDSARAGNPCATSASFDECVACYEECGIDCSVQESCPAQYTCQ